LIRGERSFKQKIKLPLVGWKNSVAIRFFLFFVIAVVFYFSLSDRLISETYDIQVDMASEKDIKAPAQIVNEIATEKAQKQAGLEVSAVYTDVAMKNIELVGNVFKQLEKINTDEQLNTNEKVDIYRNFMPTEYEFFFEKFISNYVGNDTLLNEMNKQLNSQQYRIPEEVFYKFPRLSIEDLNSMESVARTLINRVMSNPVLEADNARATVAEMVNGSELSKQLTRELVQEIVRFAITPNKFLDEEATLEARVAASANVEPVIVEKNELIVREGQMITEEIYQLLSGLNLLKERADYRPELGLIILVSLFVFLLYVFIRQSNLPIRTSNVPLIMLVLIYTLNVISMKIVALGQNLDYPYIGYLAPVALGSMLIAILLDVRLAYISTVIFSFLASIIFNIDNQDIIFDFRYGFVTAVVCFVSIFSIYRASQRATILKAGILISIFASISILSIILLNNEYVVKDIVLSLAFAFAGGLLTAVLVIGLLPFFEVSFGILSPLKLVELSNPNHPLLRKLLTETPGSYHHSVMVGNLSETAAESIGANGLLCRVGSFYHDVGKTKRPSYFIENQVNIENPHDFIEPDLSKSIIIAHARDGVEMLNEYKMPKQICDIAEQHHGTTMLTFFYHKALKQEKENPTNGDPILEEDYRYPGPKAQSKEAAIVGISDCVEAAVRSLRNPTMEQIDSMVDKIIKNRMDDDQFNECDLTLKELDTIGKTLKETLLGIFHSRIEYPDLPNKSEDKGVKL
jgi:putative nucleotidyltransferase with HDIG domain